MNAIKTKSEKMANLKDDDWQGQQDLVNKTI